MHKKELIQMYAFLPVKLSELSKVNPEAVIEILQDGAQRERVYVNYGVLQSML